MRNSTFWAVAYRKHVKFVREDFLVEAAKKAFGLLANFEMTVMRLPNSPRKMSSYMRKKLLKYLEEKHLERTGYRIWYQQNLRKKKG